MAVKNRVLVLMVLAAALSAVASTPAHSQTDSVHLGNGLSAALKPFSVTHYRGYVRPGSKGITSARFLNLDQPDSNIQIAFVLDATISMSNDIEGLRANLQQVIDGIRNQVTKVSSDDVRVEVAVVIYRDLCRASDDDPAQPALDPGTGELVLRENPVQVHPSAGTFLDFDDADERSNLDSFLSRVKVETGTPHFQEQVDRGLEAALGLEWARSPAVTRVIFLAGDAPPFEEEFISNDSSLFQIKDYEYWSAWLKRRPNLPTLRGVRTADLIKRSNSLGISIHSVRCNTSISNGPQEIRAGRFFEQVATGTGGSVLDLTEPRIVQRLMEISTGRVTSLVELKTFKADEVIALQKRTEVEPVKVAFLPLIPLEKLDYRDRFGNPAYRIVSNLARTVRDRDTTLASTFDDVRRTWSAVTDGTQSREPEVLLPLLAEELKADFLVWGSLEADSKAVLNIVDSGGNPIGTETIDDVTLENTNAVWKSVSSAIASISQSGHQTAIRFVSLTKDIDLGEEFARYSSSPENLELLNEAYMRLEEAAGYPRGETESLELTKQAEISLTQLIERDSSNAAALMLLASCAANRDARETLVERLKQAGQIAAGLPEGDLLRLEIEGDIALYVTQSPAEAIERYQLLLEKAPEMSRTALRATWILAGIYLGDWGINADRLYTAFSVKDCQNNARTHILSMLANWPDSPEARFYDRYIDPPIKRRRTDPGETDPALVAEKTEYQIRVPSTRPAAVTAGLLDWSPPTEDAPSSSPEPN